MTGDAALPDWVIEAARMPVGFAQVREDPLIDLAVLRHLHRRSLSGVMIASGGCTAAALAASERFSRLHLVDVNPAQIAICRLKLHLLQTATPIERYRLLGHAPMPNGRADALTRILESLDLPPDALGPPEVIARLGPDHSGRYELLFARLRSEFSPFAGEFCALLNFDDPAQRAAAISDQTSLGRALDDAVDRTMALPNLIRLFSAQATQNSAQPFSRHFASRTRWVLANLPTTPSPWLWQMLIGRFQDGAGYPWLSAPPPRHMPTMTLSVARFDDALEGRCEEFDFVHLSNILDWLCPEEARRTLVLARAALRKGGIVLIRQLNSTLDIPMLDDGFEWLADKARALHRHDHSFFYSGLYLGRKR